MKKIFTNALILGLALAPTLSWAKVTAEEELLKGVFQIKDEVQKKGKISNDQLEKQLKPLIERYSSQAKFDSGFPERFLNAAVEKGVVSPVQAEEALKTLNARLQELSTHELDQATVQSAVAPIATEMLNNTSGLRLGRCGVGLIVGGGLGFGTIIAGLLTHEMKDGTPKNMAAVGTAAIGVSAIVVFSYGAYDCT